MKLMHAKYVFASLALAALTHPASAENIPSNGLIAMYLFNGNADDASGNNNHGLVQGPTLTPDRFNQPNSAYAFQSAGVAGPTTDQVISIPPNIFNGDEGTISLWFNAAQNITGSNGSIALMFARTNFREENGDPGVADFLSPHLGNFTSVLNGEILGNSGGTGINNNKRSGVSTSLISNISSGWHHFALTSDASGHKFYLDAVEFTPNLFANGVTSSTNIWLLDAIEATIGGVPLSPGSSDGNSKSYNIDDVFIYTQALTNSEITDLFNADNPLNFTCAGFEAPMNVPVTVKKNRALPIKGLLLDETGSLITDADILSPPVIQIAFSPITGEDPEDVTDQSLSAGQGMDGNQFEFADNEKWRFNLKTKNYTSAGSYVITMVSGDPTEYMINSTCEAIFIIN